MKKFLQTTAVVLLVALIAVPTFAARGTADFSKLVTVGDSYGAGFESGSLNANHQPWSWSAILAQQVGYRLCTPADAATANCFAQPLVSFPGISNELRLQSIIPSAAIAPAAGTGVPLMVPFARPYNNLSVPGATVGSLLVVNGGEFPRLGEPTVVSFARFILRNQGTQVQQAVAQHPTFIAMWIGGNDYLNVMFSGDPATLTSAAAFKTQYETVLDQLIAGAPTAGMVVGNLPTGIPPYLRLVPPYLVDPSTGQPVLVGGQRVYYVVQTGTDAQGNPIVSQINDTTLVPLQTRDKLARGYGLPPAFRNIPPFNQLDHVGEPLSPSDVITAEEFQTVVARVGEYNAAINAAAAARNIPVADIAGLFNRVTTTGEKLGPITVTGAPVTGGFFSLDFFHLTDLGYLMFANEYIKAINNGYGTEIPLASITQLFTNNGAFFGDGTPSASANSLIFTNRNGGMTDEALRSIMKLWSQPAASKTRLRAVNH